MKVECSDVAKTKILRPRPRPQPSKPRPVSLCIGLEINRVTTLHTIWNSLTIRMLSVTHIMPVLVLLSVLGVGMRQCMIQNHIRHNSLLLNTCMDTNMHFTINSFKPLFPDKIFSQTIPWFSVKSLTFPWQLSNSLTFPGFPDKWSP